MKIWHPATDKLSGGPKTFMKYFDEYFKDNLVEMPTDAEILFGLNNWVPIETIRINKLRGLKYVHRANGVFRPILLNVPNWKERNEEIKPHYLEADHVIFQSVYSHRGYFEYMGETSEYSIIYNGVDVERYKPQGIKKISDILLLGKALTSKECEIKQYVRGSFMDKCCSLSKYETKEELADAVKDISLAVDPDPQANCNNLCLELMALGIPVVCLAEGGNPELCLPELIASEDNIIDKIQYILDNQGFFSKRVREHVVNNFSIKDCMEKYRKVFEECLK